jgi:putative transposase
MPYRRSFAPGGAFFFTVVTFRRRPYLAEQPAVDLLRQALRTVMQRHPFKIEAAVILPDHLHMIWRLPEGDSDYPTRWRLVKSYFSHRWEDQQDGLSTASRQSKSECAVWQRRYWEHFIRDDADLERHVEYIHYNPVKHGLAKSPGEWQYSSFRWYVKAGLYAWDWAGVPGLLVDERME